MKILVADDSVIMQRMVSSKLKTLGYMDEDLVYCNNGRDVVNFMVADPEIGLVLLDWNMPLMNGISCLKLIKATDQIKDIPVIMVTSESDRSKIISAVQSGAANYLLKPFDEKKLRAAIDKVLSGGRATGDTRISPDTSGPDRMEGSSDTGVCAAAANSPDAHPNVSGVADAEQVVPQGEISSDHGAESEDKP